MRIIGGKHRGRKLNRVDIETTRETADMVKEAVFNSLGGQLHGVVLDLFAGSGAYGLESISRGATHAHLVDSNRHAIKTIYANTKMLDMTSVVSIYHLDYLQAIQSFPNDVKFDVVFLDPPYEMNIYESVIEALFSYLNNDSTIVCESKKQLSLPDQIGSFVKTKDKTYGIKRISIYRHKKDDQ